MALRAERRQQRAREREHAEEIRLHHAPDLGVGQILKHAGNRDTGIVHHRVEGVAGLGQD